MMHTMAAIFLAAAPAAAQDLARVPLECETAPGGAMCQVAMPSDGTLLYCVAEGTDGTPIANTTVASDAGTAAFNGVRVEEIAALSCRAE